MEAKPPLCRPCFNSGLFITSTQQPSRLRRIRGDLRLQRVQPGELPLLADIGVQRDGEFRTVQIAGEVEDVDLQPALRSRRSPSAGGRYSPRPCACDPSGSRTVTA